MNKEDREKLEWMLDNDHSIDELIQKIAETAYEELNNDGYYSLDKVVEEAFNIFEHDRGFDGEIWGKKKIRYKYKKEIVDAYIEGFVETIWNECKESVDVYTDLYTFTINWNDLMILEGAKKLDKMELREVKEFFDLMRNLARIYRIYLRETYLADFNRYGLIFGRGKLKITKEVDIPRNNHQKVCMKDVIEEYIDIDELYEEFGELGKNEN